MAGNRRVFYAVQRAGIAPLGDPNYETLRGLQTLGLTTSFNLEQAFEIGQLEIYENIEGNPDVEVTTEKVLDGYAPVYILATQQSGTGGSTSASLTGRSTARSTLAIEIYTDTFDAASPNRAGQGPAGAAVELSGLYVSAVTYNVPVEGNATESCTLVGNNKYWKNGNALTFIDDPFLNNNDSPAALAGSGGVNRREDVLLGVSGSVFPSELPGVVAHATGSGYVNLGADGEYTAHMQNISISTDLGREELFELGRKGPYFRFVTFPTEVTSEITMTAASGDQINATEDVSTGCGATNNLTDQTIILKMCEGLHVDCGQKNKLSSIGVTGGDAGGGNVEVTYTYSNFNSMSVYHTADPRVDEAAFRPPGGFYS
jgi:hypothetical protein